MNNPEGFKVKGKWWAGNIYHQFESICQDVDNFMSKETVQLVENQVQNVGMNMKKLYSNVVQDILPPSEEPVEPKAQAKDCKLVENSQLSLNQDSTEPSQNSDEPLPLEEVPFQEPKADKSPSNSLQEEITSGELIVNTGERMSFDIQKNWDEFSDNEESVSNMSNSGWLFDSELTLFEDPKLDGNSSLSARAVSSDDKVNGDNDLSLNPQFPSFGDGVSNKDENSHGTKTVPSPEVVVSYFSCDDDDEEEEKQAPEQKAEKAEETNDVSCTCSISPKPSSLLESKNTAYETKTVDLPRAFSIFGSNGLSAPTSTLSGSKDYSSEVARIPFETGNINGSFAGINDLNLETVDLSPDVKHEDERVHLNCEFDRAASHRKNFRYYKKLIQDTFTSRKRLSKEYEHLAILYGDIDTESREYFRPSTVPSSPNKYIYQDISDHEWELI